MSKSVTLTQAREYFALDVISEVTLVKSDGGDGWSVVMQATNGDVLLLTTARGERRLFAKLESAVNAIEEIGVAVESLRVIQ